MRRRDFIASLGGAMALAPAIARAQQRMRRVGVLMNQANNESVAVARFGALIDGLQQRGWVEGRNVAIDVRWGEPNPERFRRDAAGLVALQPDVIVAASGATMPSLMQATRSVPIVFLLAPDPVGSGFVESLARPGGHITGFTPFEFGMSGKWLALLKEMAPRVKRAAVLRDPGDPAGVGQFGAIRTASPSIGIEVQPIDVRDPPAIERGVASFASGGNGGLVITGSTPAATHRDLIISLAERHRLPAIYPYGFFAAGGGLIAYGPDMSAQFRDAASYVDRILKGEKPADLPVQAANKYELVINLRTAKALGLTAPPTLLAQASQVIE